MSGESYSMVRRDGFRLGMLLGLVIGAISKWAWDVLRVLF
jgi:hypothetical protein